MRVPAHHGPPSIGIIGSPQTKTCTKQENAWSICPHKLLLKEYCLGAWNIFLIVSSFIQYNCPIIQFLPLNRFHRSTTTTMTCLPLYILVFCKESSLLLMIGLVSRYRDWISASTIQPETLNRTELPEKLILHFRFFLGLGEKWLHRRGIWICQHLGREATENRDFQHVRTVAGLGRLKD